MAGAPWKDSIFMIRFYMTQPQQYILPVAEYQHPEGISITGGYVYRGKQYPDLDGIYLFSDWGI